MGQRFEQNRTRVTENRNENERIRGEQTTLTNEYSPLHEINSFLDSLDDEIIASVENVQEVGASEQSRLDGEKEQVSSEADQIASQLDDEIGKLDAGMKKLDQLDAFGFGQNALDKGKSDYQKQIEQYRALKAELEEIQESGDTSHLDQVINAYAEQIQEIETSPEENTDTQIGGANTNYFKGTVNGQNISNHIEEFINTPAPNSQATGFAEHFGHERMLQIANAQGFNVAPRIVSADEFNHYAEQSGIVGFRTLEEASDGDSEKYVREFQYEDNILYNPSDYRMHGDGLYLTSTVNSTPGILPGEKAINDAQDVSSRYGKYVMKMTFTPDTNFIDEDELHAMFYGGLSEYEQENVYNNSPNAYATALGIDAVVAREAGGRNVCDYTVVLNRSKLVVQEGYEVNPNAL